MLPRPYFCEICRKTFRTPGGREWHIAHLHDTPVALNSIRIEYLARANKLTEENSKLSSENEDLRFKQLVEQSHALIEKTNLVEQQDKILDVTERLQHDKEMVMISLALKAQGTSQSPMKPPEITQGKNL